ncbi:unnamed protein product [Danaus chrysippus]|uniref:(African queen) hypothetical protein n=1 Tax=Danaus chrysippus TaxID=151541 RepID=A0A8J2VS29_9NEOP|nr:unnamed protein product [Danaus chrysippus]
MGFCTLRPLDLPYMRWGLTKPKVVDAASALVGQRTYSSATEQPSTSAHSPIVDGNMVEDSILSDVYISAANEVVENNIEAEVDHPIEERPLEDSTESSTVQTSDTAASANLNFFLQKKKNSSSLKMSHCVFQAKINFK